MTRRIDPTALARFGKLSLVAREVVEGFLTGLHKSPYKGFSVEFAEHRQYYPGDEIRHIDWRVLGKTDRFYVKEFEEETNLQAWLLLDASGSMGYAGAGPSKLDFAVRTAASLAYLMLHQMDAVGLMVHDDHIRERVPPGASPKQLLRLLQVLEKVVPGKETSLGPLWESFGQTLGRRGLVIVLSDCFDAAAPLLQALRYLRHRRHEVILFQVLAPEEFDFPFTKRTRFRNLENLQDQRMVDPGRLRAVYRRNFDAFREELRLRCAEMQVDYRVLRTDEPIEKALGTYLSHRRT